jgi:hypothetical protein
VVLPVSLDNKQSVADAEKALINVLEGKYNKVILRKTASLCLPPKILQQ